MGLRLTPQDSNHAWYWRPNQLHRASGIMDFGGEPTTATTPPLISIITMNICPNNHRKNNPHAL